MFEATIGLLVTAVGGTAASILDIVRRTRASSREALLRERNHQRFAELRKEFLTLATDGRVRSQGAAFDSIYSMLTTLMNSPQEYERAVKRIMTIPSEPTARSSRPSKFTPHEVEFYRSVAHAFDQLCRDYSADYAVSAWMLDVLAKRLPRGHEMQQLPLWVQVQFKNSRPYRQIAPLRHARRRLEGFGSRGGVEAHAV